VGHPPPENGGVLFIHSGGIKRLWSLNRDATCSAKSRRTGFLCASGRLIIDACPGQLGGGNSRARTSIPNGWVAFSDLTRPVCMLAAPKVFLSVVLQIATDTRDCRKTENSPSSVARSKKASSVRLPSSSRVFLFLSSRVRISGHATSGSR
jgi:hypothetical protein